MLIHSQITNSAMASLVMGLFDSEDFQGLKIQTVDEIL